MKAVFAAAGLAFFLATPSQAAVIYLKAGGTIEGTVVSATAQDLEIYTDGQKVRIGVDRVLRVDYQGQSPASSAQRQPTAPAFRRRWSRPPPEYDPERDMLSFEFGLAAPMGGVNFNSIGGGSSGNGDVGPLVGLQYLHGLDEHWAAGVDFNYFHRSGAGSSSLLPNADSVVFGDDLVFLGLVKYSFVAEGRARPYAAVGLGLGNNSTAIDATPRPGFSWSDTGTDETRRLVDADAWTWASSLRLGVDFLTFWDTVFGLEMGWTHLGSANYPATGQGQALGLGGIAGPVDAFTVGGRWGWRF